MLDDAFGILDGRSINARNNSCRLLLRLIAFPNSLRCVFWLISFGIIRRHPSKEKKMSNRNQYSEGGSLNTSMFLNSEFSESTGDSQWYLKKIASLEIDTPRRSIDAEPVVIDLTDEPLGMCKPYISNLSLDSSGETRRSANKVQDRKAEFYGDRADKLSTSARSVESSKRIGASPERASPDDHMIVKNSPESCGHKGKAASMRQYPPVPSKIQGDKEHSGFFPAEARYHPMKNKAFSMADHVNAALIVPPSIERSTHPIQVLAKLSKSEKVAGKQRVDYSISMSESGSEDVLDRVFNTVERYACQSLNTFEDDSERRTHHGKKEDEIIPPESRNADFPPIERSLLGGKKREAETSINSKKREQMRRGPPTSIKSMNNNPIIHEETRDALDTFFEGIEGFACQEGGDPTITNKRYPLDDVFESMEHFVCHTEQSEEGSKARKEDPVVAKTNPQIRQTKKKSRFETNSKTRQRKRSPSPSVSTDFFYGREDDLLDTIFNQVEYATCGHEPGEYDESWNDSSIHIMDKKSNVLAAESSLKSQQITPSKYAHRDAKKVGTLVAAGSPKPWHVNSSKHARPNAKKDKILAADSSKKSEQFSSSTYPHRDAYMGHGKYEKKAVGEGHVFVRVYETANGVVKNAENTSFYRSGSRPLTIR